MIVKDVRFLNFSESSFSNTEITQKDLMTFSLIKAFDIRKLEFHGVTKKTPK